MKKILFIVCLMSVIGCSAQHSSLSAQDEPPVPLSPDQPRKTQDELIQEALRKTQKYLPTITSMMWEQNNTSPFVTKWKNLLAETGLLQEKQSLWIELKDRPFKFSMFEVAIAVEDDLSISPIINSIEISPSQTLKIRAENRKKSDESQGRRAVYITKYVEAYFHYELNNGSFQQSKITLYDVKSGEEKYATMLE